MGNGEEDGNSNNNDEGSGGNDDGDDDNADDTDNNGDVTPGVLANVYLAKTICKYICITMEFLRVLIHPK